MAMEDGGLSSEKQPQGASYTYWVRETTAEAAPPPVPRKLSSDDILSSKVSQPPVLGSLWNRDLLMWITTLEFSSDKAELKDVSKCVGDASIEAELNEVKKKAKELLSLLFTDENEEKIDGERYWNLADEFASMVGERR